MTIDVKVPEKKYVDSDWDNEKGLVDLSPVDMATSSTDIVECNIIDDVKVYSLTSDMMLSTDTEVDSDGEGETVSTTDIAVFNASVDGKKVSTVDAITSNEKEVDSDGEEYIVSSITGITKSEFLKVSSDDTGVVITSIVDDMLSNDTEVGSITDKRKSDSVRVDVMVFNIVEASNNNEEVGISLENTRVDNDIE